MEHTANSGLALIDGHWDDRGVAGVQLSAGQHDQGQTHWENEAANELNKAGGLGSDVCAQTGTDNRVCSCYVPGEEAGGCSLKQVKCTLKRQALDSLVMLPVIVNIRKAPKAM